MCAKMEPEKPTSAGLELVRDKKSNDKGCCTFTGSTRSQLRKMWSQGSVEQHM